MDEAGKTQLIRLADILLIGPLMIYSGTGKRMPPILRDALVVMGVLTIVYNGANFLARQKETST